MQNTATVQISMELWGAILCLIFAAFIFIGEEKRSSRSRLLIAILLQALVLLVSDAAAWLYRGDAGTLAFYAVRISNYLVFIMYYVIGYTVLLYLEQLLRQNSYTLERPAKWLITGICFLGVAMVTLSQFTGFLYTINEQNLYTRSGGYWSICVVAGVMLLMQIGCMLHYFPKVPKLQIFPLLLVFVLTLAAEIIQFAFYGISLVNIAMTVGILVMFFSYEKERIAISAERERKLLENTLRLVQQEAELARKDAEMANVNAQLVEKRTQIMLSQIQPHFLYNALSAISFLCIKDPMKAKETIDHFATYLRTNLNSLRNDHLVSFRQELNHTKAYLAIEQTRFGDDLNLVYAIECEDFLLPSLSLQPVVENAVRHGICGKEDGGTVTIRSERRDGHIVITVTDDGVGFDPSVKPQDGRSHVGMENVAQRLETLCGGRLIVESQPGVGTTATLLLPDLEG